MRLMILMVAVVMALVTVDAAKITWDPDGKPHIEKSNKPIKGCNMNDLKSLESNTTKKPCK